LALGAEIDAFASVEQRSQLDTAFLRQTASVRVVALQNAILKTKGAAFSDETRKAKRTNASRSAFATHGSAQILTKKEKTVYPLMRSFVACWGLRIRLYRGRAARAERRAEHLWATLTPYEGDPMSRQALSLLVVIATLTAVANLTGCGAIRVVRRTKAGGEIALEGLPEKARVKANDYMSAQCPSGFDILEEGEAVIGSESTASTTSGRSLFGQPSLNSRSSTTDKTEWRIKYECKGDNAKSGAVRELMMRF